jgi:hypothetical protein
MLASIRTSLDFVSFLSKLYSHAEDASTIFFFRCIFVFTFFAQIKKMFHVDFNETVMDGSVSNHIYKNISKSRYNSGSFLCLQIHSSLYPLSIIHATKSIWNE